MGTNIRNSFSLWSLKRDNIKLYTEFAEIGIIHADDMSTIIIEKLKAKINNDSYDLNGRLLKIWGHWKEYDVKMLPTYIKEANNSTLELYNNFFNND